MIKETKILRNIIYCEDSHSLVHRLYDKWSKDGMPENHRFAQFEAMDIMRDLVEELEDD